MDLPTSFNEARDIYLDAPDRRKSNPRGLKLANNTYLRWGDRHFAVRLHDTDVVTFHDDGTIELDTGGWDTVTTKQRMNACLRQYRVFQHAHVWYVCAMMSRGGSLPIPTECLGLKKAHGRRVYEDGMTLHPEGLWHDEEMKYDGQI
jgi:hypothetical protein